MSRLRIAVATAFSLLVLAPAMPAAAAPAVQVTQVTGTRLAGALLPPSWFGPGLRVIPDSTWNSGGKLEHGRAKYNLATVSCATFFFGSTGFGETAAAGSSVGIDLTEYLQAVYQFASPGGAAAFFRGSYRDFGRCRSAVFTVGAESVRVKTQSTTAGHAGKYQAFVVDMSTSEQSSGSNVPIVTTDHVLYVLAGTDVYDVVPNISGTTSTAPPGNPQATSIAFALIARVEALLPADPDR
jgi:hypothetical protein